MDGANLVLGLAGRFYEGVEDDSAMPAALNALAEAAGGHHAMVAQRREVDGGWRQTLGNIDPELGKRLPGTLQSGPVRLWLDRIPEAGWERMCAMVPAGTPLSRALYDTPFYSEFVQPLGVHHAALTAMSLGESRSFLSVFRPANLGDYEPEAMAVLEAVRPHLERAFRLTQRLGEATAAAQGAFGMLDRLQSGVVLLDRKLRLLFVNRAARAMTDATDALVLDARGLRPSSPALARQLQALILEAATSFRPPSRARRLSLMRDDRPYPLLLHVERLETPGLRAAGACVGLFIDDPGADLAVDAGALEEAFGLTSREAALAAELARGASLRDAADHLDIAEATARTHLKRVLEKSGAHRQAELVGLVAGLARR